MVDDGHDVAEVLEAVLERTGYRAELEESEDPQDATRVENLNELVTVAREFAQMTSGRRSRRRGCPATGTAAGAGVACRVPGAGLAGR